MTGAKGKIVTSLSNDSARHGKLLCEECGKNCLPTYETLVFREHAIFIAVMRFFEFGRTTDIFGQLRKKTLQCKNNANTYICVYFFSEK